MWIESLKPVMNEVQHGHDDGAREREVWKLSSSHADATAEGAHWRGL